MMLLLQNHANLFILQDLQGILNDVPEISLLVGTTIINRVSSITTENGEDEIRDVLKQLFTQLMSASQPEVADILTQLTSRLRMKDKVSLSFVFFSL